MLKSQATCGNKRSAKSKKQTEGVSVTPSAAPTNLISFFKLGVLLHLLLLQACGDLFDLIGQQLDDLGQQTEHSLWDDLKTHTSNDFYSFSTTKINMG